MVTIGPIVLTFDSAPLTQSIRDLASLVSRVEVLGDLAERVDCQLARVLGNGGMLSNEQGDLIFREPVNLPASGASKVESFQLHPSDGYLELFAALAGACNAHIFFRHGWPALSLVGDTASMTEAGGESIAPGGGAFLRSAPTRHAGQAAA